MIGVLRARLTRITSGEDRDRGISLVELLVAMLIFSFLLTMTAGFFVSASRAQATNQQIDNTNRVAETGLEEMARVIRGAITNPVLNQQVNDPEFVSNGTVVVGPNTVTVYSSINLTASTAQTEKVQFSVVGTNLMEYTWLPTVVNGYSTYAVAASSQRILASPVVLPAAGGPNLFSYLDGTGTVIPFVSGQIPSTSIINIAAVTITIQIGPYNTANQSTLLTNTVGLPNVNVARNPS